MKHFLTFLVFTFFLSGCFVWNAEESQAASRLTQLVRAGYSCVNMGVVSSSWMFNNVQYRCSRTTYSNVAHYSATKNDYRTLTGYRYNVSTPVTHTESVTQRVRIPSQGDGGGASDADSPFIYFQNPPEGDISLTLDSELDTYYPKPSFNTEQGWLVNVEGGDMTLSGEEVDNLFYELEVSKLTLSRNGRNFSSKDELVEYLQHSDFLDNLGFTEIEKQNALGYFLPKLKKAEDAPHYYLTILTDEAIAEISQLSVEPAPENIIRQYFAVYPSVVPVATVSDFTFPMQTTSDGFTVKETGEFLVKDSTQVFFETN